MLESDEKPKKVMKILMKHLENAKHNQEICMYKLALAYAHDIMNNQEGVKEAMVAVSDLILNTPECLNEVMV